MARPADPRAKAALVAAARREFQRAGIIGSRIEDITAACHLSKGSFYLHYPSKEALFGELVQAFQAQLASVLEARTLEVQRFMTGYGALDVDDVRERSRRSRQFMALEERLDRELLELIWQQRDVFEVLVNGCQGTPFAGLIWQFLDGEVQRVASDVELGQRSGAIRADVAPEVYGSMMVGTWLMIARQMLKLSAPPDLGQWVQALHRLVREGCAPTGGDEVAVARRTAGAAVAVNEGGVA